MCAYGVKDSTIVFGTISLGSNPNRHAKINFVPIR